MYNWYLLGFNLTTCPQWHKVQSHLASSGKRTFIVLFRLLPKWIYYVFAVDICDQWHVSGLLLLLLVPHRLMTIKCHCYLMTTVMMMQTCRQHYKPASGDMHVFCYVNAYCIATIDSEYFCLYSFATTNCAIGITVHACICTKPCEHDILKRCRRIFIKLVSLMHLGVGQNHQLWCQ